MNQSRQGPVRSDRGKNVPELLDQLKQLCLRDNSVSIGIAEIEDLLSAFHSGVVHSINKLLDRLGAAQLARLLGR